MKNSLLVVLVFGISAVIIGGGIWMSSASARKISSLSTREVALLCTTDMATQFHIHPVLKIVINGEEQIIPAEIGIQPTCMNSLHTHDATGTLHVEAPEKRDFTLGDFFAVWQKPFSQNELLDFKADATHKVSLTVNGAEVDTFENTILNDLDHIVISYESI